jgi:hypothetical protein
MLVYGEFVGDARQRRGSASSRLKRIRRYNRGGIVYTTDFEGGHEGPTGPEGERVAALAALKNAI